jgi:hypothetical protein
VGFDFGCSLLLGGRFCDGRMNAEEICLCFILIVDSCECQATNVFDEMFVRKFICL